MLKSRKTILIIAVVVALMAGYYWLGTTYLQEQKLNDLLTVNVDAATRQLADIPVPDKDLQQRLNEAQVEMAAAEDAFPVQPSTTEIINTILQAADDLGLKAIPMETRPWGAEAFDDYEVYVFQMNFIVSGASASLTEFLTWLESGQIATLVIEYISIEKADPATYQESLADNSTLVRADLDIAVYARSPED